MCDEITRGKAAGKFSTKIQHENIALQFHRTSCGSARKCLDYPRLDLSKSVKTTRARFLAGVAAAQWLNPHISHPSTRFTTKSSLSFLRIIMKMLEQL
jgi:hypothetical protein